MSQLHIAKKAFRIGDRVTIWGEGVSCYVQLKIAKLAMNRSLSILFLHSYLHHLASNRDN